MKILKEPVASHEPFVQVSSGSKLVSPEDDAAGLAVSMRFDAQINRVSAANTNNSNAISFSQTQDGFLKKVSKALDRMSELAILAQDVTKDEEGAKFTMARAQAHRP